MQTFESIPINMDRWKTQLNIQANLIQVYTLIIYIYVLTLRIFYLVFNISHLYTDF